MLNRIPALALAAMLLASCGSEPTSVRAPERPRTSMTALTASIYGPSTVQRGSTCLFEAQVSGGTPPYSYAWNTDNGAYSYTNQLWVTAPGPGFGIASYIIELYITDSGGESAELVKPVNVVHGTGAYCHR